MLSQIQACRAIVDSITSTELPDSVKLQIEELKSKLSEISSEKRPREETDTEEPEKKQKKPFLDSDGFFDSHDAGIVSKLRRKVNIMQEFQKFLCEVYLDETVKDIRFISDGVAIATVSNVFHAFRPEVCILTKEGYVTGKWKVYESVEFFDGRPFMFTAANEMRETWKVSVDVGYVGLGNGEETDIEVYAFDFDSEMDWLYKFTRVVPK